MTAALALAGVVLGALLSGGVQLALARRRERQELRVAARTVWSELVYCVMGLRNGCEQNRWPNDPKPYALKSFPRAQPLLLAHLPYGDWLRLELAVRGLRDVHPVIANPENYRPFDRRSAEAWGDLGDIITRALDALDPLTVKHHAPPPFGMLARSLRRTTRNQNAWPRVAPESRAG